MDLPRIGLKPLQKLCALRGGPQSANGARFAPVACELAGGSAEFREGGLHAPNGLQVRTPLVVDGDLVVDGCLEDCVGLDHNVVIVTGDLRCRGLISNAETVVFGSVRVDGDAWLMSLGNNTLHVGKNLQARIVATGGHWLDLHGKLKAKAVVGGLQRVSGDGLKNSFKHRVLHPSLYRLECSKAEAKEMEADEFDDCCELKERDIVRRILKGRTLGK